MEKKQREEQKQRELELQRRKMRTMDITKATSGKLEDLVALPTSSKISSSPTRSKVQDHPSSIGFMQTNSGPAFAARKHLSSTGPVLASSGSTPTDAAVDNRHTVKKAVSNSGDGSNSPAQHLSKSEKLESSSSEQPADYSGKGKGESTLIGSNYFVAIINICMCY